ncbi:hypothetical protein FTX61_16750 [Nitriliruptoraceae bacterium ZYF776]|nr:hypothetical protein [Profundirhabdus halotolerans]
MRRLFATTSVAALVAGVAVAATPTVASAQADPCAGAPRAPYVDVPDGSVHAPAVDCLHGLRVIQGRLVDAYQPSSDVRRDQMATIVAGAIEAAGGRLPAGDASAFRDLHGNPHRQAIQQLAAAGIVQGKGDGRYDPGAAVPRGQMTAFLVGAHEFVTGREVRDAPDAFRDDDGHAHEASIDKAVHLGLAEGRSSTRFDPQERTRRDQTASFVTRLYRQLAADRGTSGPSWGFEARTTALPDTLRRSMTGSSWRSGCPVGLDDLRLVELVHRDLRGTDRVGLLVVHRGVAGDVVHALRRGYEAGFRIERMRLVDHYGADDDRSMRNNNTHAFNCRRVAGSSNWSEHAYGRALDINPIQNPYVRGSYVAPDAGRAYLDRSNVRPGMLTGDDAVVRAFKDRGWGWGGDWSSVKDYHHLSSTGR